MKWDIYFRNMNGGGDTIGYIDRRFSFTFSRLRHYIDSAAITLTDLNGPKAGVDKQCKVVIKPLGLKPIVVTEKRDTLVVAIDRAITRAGQCLSRRLKRRQVLARKLPAEQELGLVENL
ncbi:HPF/RaiA family ribosome-associated protein [Pseudomaricurvus alkylphenolicus]|jgi:hypothetical protein|uniref:HPF/RaiA family ribosome-associated protein n=1 Tax=Pseudomaricurvus alkylphenolicus TaxID=1306991 RepID=UPI0014230775|nr:HPF/RaiA family ribosome-associated protein [Pseudomaricurvus alkylphenolicus]NIB38788.1 HPF/RaiA family ribosome-associated protein [Pseudomaricurvus alkylphenolicus]